MKVEYDIDGYEIVMSVEEAQEIHRAAIAALTDAEVDNLMCNMKLGIPVFAGPSVNEDWTGNGGG